jgi:hypothetical protein
VPSRNITEIIPTNVCARFFYENRPRLSRLLLCKWL